MTRRFVITYDYLCPFARNACEHVITALRAGADWDVTFVAYSLTQGHVADGEPDIWVRDEPEAASGILAFLAGLAVRDTQPERFLDAVEALFAARHDHGHSIKDRDVVRDALRDAGVDTDTVMARMSDGDALKTLRREHEAAVSEHDVWGVPTFVAGDRAVFVRVLDRPAGDAELARRRIEQIIDLVEDAPMLHEFKQTVLHR